MHEMSLAMSIVETIETEATHRGFGRVERVVLEIGALACVDPHALTFGFDAAMRGTCCDGAELEILTVPGMAYCFDCQKNVEISRKGDACPECGSYQIVVTGGEEMKIKSLEVC
ncbi:MAG: hydrogenase maturation nickel metallochaperone HypA [Rhodobiaceae bacterium]|nr:hydrogenase maturation nickel metallochaperone HypA [Hyphomonas sp.]MCC0050318.1 hydrogenase maturation nickel metallochaperone HypA [Rhodobiaceae bacterium]